MASMLKNGRDGVYGKLVANGCSCCNPKRDRRKETKIRKRKEERQWKKDQNVR